MKLYWYWSFNPQKIRLALNELGLDFDLVTIDLFKGEQRTEAYGRLHPRQRVPVLEDDGKVLWESNAMLVYLGEKTRQLWPDTAMGKADAIRWLFFESRHLSDSVGRLWFNDYVLPSLGQQGNDEAREIGAKNLPGELQVVENQLRRQDYLPGDEPGLVDCCYGPVLDALSLSKFSLDEYPGVRAYLDRMRARPAWTACEFRTA